VSKYGIQQLLVLGAFVGIFALSTRAFRNPGKLEYLSMAVSVSATGSTLAYYVTSYTQGLGAEGWFSPRSFAIVALVQFAWFVSRTRYGQRQFALGSVAVLGAIFLSLSRTALFAALLAVPASIVSRLSPGRILRISGYTVLVLAVLAGAVFYFKPLNERFFEGDVSLSVGGVGVNVMGRLTVWSVLLAAFLDAPALGHGVGSSRDLIEEHYSGSIIHPHNDYIRVLYEYGVVGLFFLLWGLGNLVWSTWRQWHNAERFQSAHSWLHCAAFLLLLIYCILMMTDNLMVYNAFQVPLAAVLGASCALRPTARTGMVR
jgi:O-antigen ligase